MAAAVSEPEKSHDPGLVSMLDAHNKRCPVLHSHWATPAAGRCTLVRGHEGEHYDGDGHHYRHQFDFGGSTSIRDGSEEDRA